MCLHMLGEDKPKHVAFSATEPEGAGGMGGGPVELALRLAHVAVSSHRRETMVC